MFVGRYVAAKLAAEKQSQMQHSSSSEDVDMDTSGGGRSDSSGSIGVVSSLDVDSDSVDELSAKFSVQGTSSSKSTGIKKVVRMPLSRAVTFLPDGRIDSVEHGI